MVKFRPCYIHSACPHGDTSKVLASPLSTASYQHSIYMSNGLLLFQVLLILSSYSVTEDDVVSYVL